DGVQPGILITDLEHNNEEGCNAEILLLPVRPERCKSLLPFRWKASLIIFALLSLRRYADFSFHLGIGNDDKAPRLLISTGWRRSCRTNTRGDDVERNRIR